MRDLLNRLGAQRTPFLFVLDYELASPYICPLDELPNNIHVTTPLYCTKAPLKELKTPPTFHKTPLTYEDYSKKFQDIQKHITQGNTYLANLTQPTPIAFEGSLTSLYTYASAPFKLCFKDQFMLFSPERFVRIESDKIHTFPMKGTIDASHPNAKESILNNQKEMAEHTMVVDLLRNDLNRVAKEVRVERFRYIDTIETLSSSLLQVSSHITGKLGEDWHHRIGDILLPLLPAGSITGTPKKKTIEILKEIEGYKRGFYTGVFGIYDGHSLDSAVMIRYIERQGDRFIFKSGGGITSESDAHAEYQELLQKINVPIS